MRKAKIKKPPPGAMRSVFAGVTALGIAMSRGMHSAGLAGWRGPLFDPAATDAGGDDDVTTSMNACKTHLQALSAAMDDLEKAMAADEGDDAAKAARNEAYKAKSKEYEKEKANLMRFQAKAARQNDIQIAKSLAAVVRPGVIPNGVAAEAKNHDAEDEAKCKSFTQWFIDPANYRMNDQIRDLMTPRGKGWSACSSGFVVPKSMTAKIMPSIFRGKALPLSSDQAGPQNLYQAELMKELLSYKGETAKLFPRCRKVPCIAGIAHWPRLKQAAPGAVGSANEFAEYGFVSVQRVAEGASAPATEPQFEQVQYTMNAIRAKTQLTRTLISRAGTTIDIVALLNELFPQAISHKLDNEIINGSGTGEMLGLLQASGIASVFRKTLGHIDQRDFIGIESPIPPDYRDDMVFIIADAAWQDFKTQEDSTGRLLYVPLTMSPTQAGTGASNRFDDHPVIPTQRLTLGNAGDLIGGVFDYYGVAVEQEVVVMANPYSAMDKNAIDYYAWMQVGGQPHEPRMFSKLAATTS